MPISILRRPAVLIVITALCSSISLPLAAQDAEPRLTEMIQSIQTDALRFSMLIQVVGDPVVDPDDDDPRGGSLAAARFRLTGRLDSGFQYLLQTNFAGSPSLLDARVGWSTSPRFAVHAGRFKAPFSRELLTYAGSIDFVNRSRAVEAISPGRQLGLQLSGREGRMGWSVGTFNGSRSDLPGDPMLGVARLEVASGAESSVQWTVGVSAGKGNDGAVGGRAQGSTFAGTGTLAGVDFRVEQGRLMLSGEWLGARYEDDLSVEADSRGGFLTAGWMTGARSQVLVRADSYRAPGATSDTQILLGWNLWPTSVSEIQVNWAIPMDGSAAPHKLLVNFQVGF